MEIRWVDESFPKRIAESVSVDADTDADGYYWLKIHFGTYDKCVSDGAFDRKQREKSIEQASGNYAITGDKLTKDTRFLAISKIKPIGITAVVAFFIIGYHRSIIVACAILLIE